MFSCIKEVSHYVPEHNEALGKHTTFMMKLCTSQFEKQVLVIRRLKPREGNGFLQGHTASSGRAGTGTHVSCLSKAYSLEKPLVLLSCFSLASINGWELLILVHAGSSGNGGGRGRRREQDGQPLADRSSFCLNILPAGGLI